MSISNLLLKFANLSCPKCTHFLTEDEIKNAQSQINAGVLVCPKCQHLISSFAAQQSHSIDKSGYKPSSKIRYVQSPEGGTEFTISWKSSTTWFAMVFGLVWSFIVGLIFNKSLQAGGVVINGVYTTDSTKILNAMMLFFLPGFAILLFSAIKLVNKRKIVVHRNLLTFFDTPFGIYKKSQIEAHNILNLSVRRQSGGSFGGREEYSNIVNIHFKDGKIKTLCETAALGDAIFIEQTIEKLFGIVDDKSLDSIN